MRIEYILARAFDESMDTCSICLETIDDRKFVIGACKHSFHRDCLLTWFETSMTCPACRSFMGIVTRDAYLEGSNKILKQLRWVNYSCRDGLLTICDTRANGPVVLSTSIGNVKRINLDDKTIKFIMKNNFTTVNAVYNTAEKATQNYRFLVEALNESSL